MKLAGAQRKQRRGRDIFVVGFVVWDKLRRSGIGLKYVAPTELADFYFVVLQICRAYGAGEGNYFFNTILRASLARFW
jgi:hypothetical protein